MTVSRLPEIAVTCKKHGHTFATRARGGQAVNCPQCRANGESVKVWVPTGRPRTAREVAAIDTPAPDSAARQLCAELAAIWEQEQPWDGQIRPVPGRDVDVCSECSGPLKWEPRRTLTYCPKCPRAGLPAAVTDHYAKQVQRAAAAPPAHTDPTAELAARARLRALRETTEQWLGDWLDSVADENSYDRSQWWPQARQLAALLRGYIPEIRTAESEAELDSIKRHIVTEILNSEHGKAIQQEYAEAQGRAERAAQQAAYQQELAAQHQAAERERQEHERQRQIAERESARQQLAERKAITSGIKTKPDVYVPQNGYMMATAQIVTMIEKNRAKKERKLAELGPCGYTQDHSKPEIPTRRYWIVTLDSQGNETGYTLPNAPQVVVCKKHYGMADKWISEEEASLKRRGYSGIRAIYTELT